MNYPDDIKMHDNSRGSPFFDEEKNTCIRCGSEFENPIFITKDRVCIECAELLIVDNYD